MAQIWICCLGFHNLYHRLGVYAYAMMCLFTLVLIYGYSTQIAILYLPIFCLVQRRHGVLGKEGRGGFGVQLLLQLLLPPVPWRGLTFQLEGNHLPPAEPLLLSTVPQPSDELFNQVDR